MNEIQQKVWDILVELTGEQVVQLFTDIYGTQILNDANVIHELKLQGYEIEDEEGERND